MITHFELEWEVVGAQNVVKCIRGNEKKNKIT